MAKSSYRALCISRYSYIGTDGLEHHLAEDIDFSELVDVEPLNPMCPVREGMNQQDFSVIENSVFEFDPIPAP